MNYYICENWGQFGEGKAKFIYDFNNNYEFLLNWEYWEKCQLNDKFNGIWINIIQETEESKNIRFKFNEKIKEKMLMIQKGWKEDVFQKYICQIWWNQIDFKANLQCNCWQKIYWFYWLINWIKVNNRKSCPNWRNTISSKSVFVNKNIESEIDTILTVMNWQNSIKWKFHLKDWDIYWQTWNWEAWSIWIIKKKHEGHQICSIELQKEITLDSAQRLININESVVTIKNKELCRLKNNKELADIINNEIIKEYRNKIDTIEEELSMKIENISKEWSEKVKANIDEWKDDEEILNEFVKNKDLVKIFKNMEAINSLNQRKEETFKTINEIKYNQKEPKFITSHSPLSYSVSIESNRIKASEQNYSILLEEESILSNEKRIKINGLNIQLSLKDSEPMNYYSKVEIKDNSLCKLKDTNKVTKMLSDSNFYNLNNLVLLNENDQTDKIELEFTVWEETEEVKKFIKETKVAINLKMQDFLSLI